MHVPPYHKKATWQRFFVGALIGAVISYCVFIYMYGYMYEQLLGENLKLKSEVTELRHQNEALLQDKKDLDEKSKQPWTVEKVEINIANDEELKIDPLLKQQLEEMIREELDDIIGQKVKTISESKKLLKSTIQNKEFTVDDFHYSFVIKTLTITNVVELVVEAKISN